MLQMMEAVKMPGQIQGAMSDEEVIAWVLGVDRRLVVLGSMKSHPILKASDIAQETNRSTQNISRALKEFNEKGFIMCLNPEKTTWKRYTITNSGRELLEKLEDIYFDPN
ncbi:sugar-specific transcriptional regulator TrmB [Methanolobus sediminis]|uniref:Sugar-specific transcriptional regulator TrmB n=1 Tax=Methanolobus sediminis TaxID=3072978 RepID=A0AA51UKD1_9EURY|nr:sugar-specific transcriptional regulator TrmB [Methanolobus sediminis]WMW25161.1 sugar-specific transcriptional regulator TrmB [Methanolobus sediminis]